MGDGYDWEDDDGPRYRAPPKLTFEVNELDKSITIRPLREGEEPKPPFVIHSTEYSINIELSGYRYFLNGVGHACRDKKEIPKEAEGIEPFHSWQTV